MNEERDWNVVMEDFGGGSNQVSYYAQRSKQNLPSEKILAQDLTEQEAFSLLCSFGDVMRVPNPEDHYYVLSWPSSN